MEVARALLEAASIRMSQDDIPTISVTATNSVNNNNNNNQEEQRKVESPESPDGNLRLKENNGEQRTVNDYWKERRGRRTSLSAMLSSLAFKSSECEAAPRSRSNTWGAEARSILAP